MRLEDVSIAKVKTALELYLAEAWGELAASHWPRIDFTVATGPALIAQFVTEHRVGRLRKFTLRLGNRRYPFMKMSFQELLLRDVFFFAVDTHDEMDIKETTPNYREWELIREHNQNAKASIEKAWRENGVPTFQDVLDEIEIQPVPPAQICRAAIKPCVLVVDDDALIAKGVRLILERRGYEVVVAHSAEQALLALRTLRPEIILSDFEMGHGLNGLQLCERVRSHRALNGVPFILATAAEIDLEETKAADGFLVKPYDIDVLVAFVSRHLRNENVA